VDSKETRESSFDSLCLLSFLLPLDSLEQVKLTCFVFALYLQTQLKKKSFVTLPQRICMISTPAQSLATDRERERIGRDVRRFDIALLLRQEAQ